MALVRKVNPIFKEYRDLMKRLVFDYEDYQLFKRGFMGGFTHASPYKVGKILEGVDSFDFTSSYPYVMLSERFPMTQPVKIIIKSDEELHKYLDYYACIFEVKFYNIKSTFFFDHYIPYSKCYRIKNPVIVNGRVASADELTITITEQDYLIIKNTYDWDKMEVYNFRYMSKDYLPKNLWLSILHFYKTKTELKGVAGKEVEYAVAKENVNSCYGMTVTDILRDVIVYENKEWSHHNVDDFDEAISKNNKSKKRFLYYPWGVWVTAYARRNLWTGIIQFGNDYIYSDTDSIKVLNREKHMDYINEYNRLTQIKLQLACNRHKVQATELDVRNSKGEKKPLGVWELETEYEPYRKFKTLGAKRYIYANSEGLHITIAGLSKKEGCRYLVETYGVDGAFDAFNDTMHIPAGRTGKLTHTYIDEEQTGVVKDYLGVEYRYDELSAVHLEPADYQLGLVREFLDFVRGVQENETLY